MIQTQGISCPNCGAAIGGDTLDCPYCGCRVYVTSFRDIASMPFGRIEAYVNSCSRIPETDPKALTTRHSAGLCYLKLQMYEKAYETFTEEIRRNFNGSEAYFYAAASMLRGKKPFLAQRSTINEIESLLRAAFVAESRGIYLYFLAYIRYDYYERKHLNVTPDYRDYLARSKAIGTPADDIRYLYLLLGTERPACL